MDKEAFVMMKGNEHPEEFNPEDKELREILSDEIYGLANKPPDIDRIVARIKDAGYFQEQAEWISRLLELGWIPPEEAKNG